MEKPNNAMLVKEASIGTDQLGKYLYLVNDSNIVRYRHIEIGQLIGDTLRQVIGRTFSTRQVCHEGSDEGQGRNEDKTDAVN